VVDGIPSGSVDVISLDQRQIHQMLHLTVNLTTQQLHGSLRSDVFSIHHDHYCYWGGSVAEWLACWTQAQKGLDFKSQPRSCRVTVLGKLFSASVHQAAKLVAALLRVAGVTAGMAESNGSLPPGL